MQAMTATELGGPDVLKLQDVPDPQPGPWDLMVEVRASALNPVDYKVRESGLGMDRAFPLILGYDVSGVVKAVGDEVEDLAVGDEVYASPSIARPGAYAEYVCVDARTAARKPGSLSHVEAAALPLVTLTAWESLHTRAGIHTGETVLIHAGAGGVGHIAVQLAGLHGCTVITTASREESIALCHELGADHVINYKERDFVDAVERITDGVKCPVVIDTVGGEVFEKSMDCVGLNGRMVGIVYTKTDQIWDKLFRMNATLHLEFMGVPPIYGVNMESHREILRTVAELADAGKIKPHVGRTIKLEDVPDAHRDLQQHHHNGKMVIDLTG